MTALVLSTMSLSLFVSLLLVFFIITRPPKCPRCGARHWIHSPHMGRYVVYCPNCLLFVDTSTGKPL
jgi:late competence protein required for DNA uptake (superfamily II DNA/RNA helicase)